VAQLVRAAREKGRSISATFKGHQGTKSKPMPGPHNVYGFLTTAPNAVVKPIHPKAMPVILKTDEERCLDARPWMRQRRCSVPCTKTT
jgi:putative SOS response-associated peptidase YedK